MALQAPLERDAIAAANWLYEHCMPQWQGTDRALARLSGAVPGFDGEAAYLKVVAINAAYSTNLKATWRMAEHIVGLDRHGLFDGEPDAVVGAIAGLPKDNGPVRHYRSFASKFAHFFISPDRFPIFDGAARTALRHHLGPAATRGMASSYPAFLEALTALRGSVGEDISLAELDRYLWLVGMALDYQRGKRELNREVIALFEMANPPQVLDILRGEL